MLAGSKAAERAAEAADGSDADEATQESLQPSSPWEKAWDSTMESSAATRVKGVKTLSTLLQSGYNYDEAIRMCAPSFPVSPCSWVLCIFCTCASQ